MKLIFRQKLFSWFDSYDVYDELGNPVFTVKGQLAWGHLLRIYDNQGRELGMVKEKVLTFLPKFELYAGDEYIGNIKKEFTLLRPKFSIDCNGWKVEGNFLEWDYLIRDANDRKIASVSKEIFHLTDTYVIDVLDPFNALPTLMLVIAIDAEKCSRN